jgi:flagellar biosynthesis protein FlhG
VSAPHTASVVAVASGKGGVGKTNVAVNLAVALARMGNRVGLLDADYGLGNVDVLLGLTPPYHVGHLFTGEAALSDLLVTGPAGVQIVPASSGLQSLTTLSPAHRAILADALARVCSALDYLVIDTASGISDNVVDTVLLAGRVMVVTSVEPAAIVDAYATVKVITAAAPGTEIGIVVNNVRGGDDAAHTYRQLDLAANRFLGRSLKFYGFIPEDAALRDAVLTQRAVVDHLPQADASRSFRILAARIAGLGPVDGPGPRTSLVRTMARIHQAEVPQCA